MNRSEPAKQSRPERTTPNASAFRHVVVVLLVLLSACTKKSEDSLDRVERLLSEGNTALAQQVLSDEKLDLTPRGAQLLVESLQQERKFRETVGAVKQRQQQFNKVERTDVCVTAIDELANGLNPEPVGGLIEACEPMVDVQRIDFEALSFAQAREPDADADTIEWFALADRLKDAESGSPADVTARVLIKFARAVGSDTPEDSRGERFIGFLEQLDAVPLRLDLISWQIRQLEGLSASEFEACQAMLTRGAGPLIDEDEELNEAFEAAKAEHQRRAASAPEAEMSDNAGDEAEETDSSSRATGCSLPSFDQPSE